MYVELETTTAPGQPTLQVWIVVGCVCCLKRPCPRGGQLSLPIPKPPPYRPAPKTPHRMHHVPFIPRRPRHIQPPPHPGLQLRPSHPPCLLLPRSRSSSPLLTAAPTDRSLPPRTNKLPPKKTETPWSFPLTLTRESVRTASSLRRCSATTSCSRSTPARTRTVTTPSPPTHTRFCTPPSPTAPHPVARGPVSHCKRPRPLLLVARGPVACCERPRRLS